MVLVIGVAVTTLQVWVTIITALVAAGTTAAMIGPRWRKTDAEAELQHAEAGSASAETKLREQTLYQRMIADLESRISKSEDRYDTELRHMRDQVKEARAAAESARAEAAAARVREAEAHALHQSVQAELAQVLLNSSKERHDLIERLEVEMRARDLDKLRYQEERETWAIRVDKLEAEVRSLQAQVDGKNRRTTDRRAADQGA